MECGDVELKFSIQLPKHMGDERGVKGAALP